MRSLAQKILERSEKPKNIDEDNMTKEEKRDYKLKNIQSSLKGIKFHYSNLGKLIDNLSNKVDKAMDKSEPALFGQAIDQINTILKGDLSQIDTNLKGLQKDLKSLK